MIRPKIDFINKEMSINGSTMMIHIWKHKLDNNLYMENIILPTNLNNINQQEWLINLNFSYFLLESFKNPNHYKDQFIVGTNMLD